MKPLQISIIVLGLAPSLMVLRPAAAQHQPMDDPGLGQIDSGYQKAGQQAVVSGVIAKINGQTITLTIGTGHNKKSLDVTADSHTKVTLDTKPSHFDKLQTGQTAQVTGVGVPAVRIDAVSGN